MSSLQPRRGHGLLRCPLCRRELTAAAGALVCRNRHSFDLAREGYVNLLRSAGRRPAAGGDSLVQLRHRADFLDAGYFDAVAAVVAGHAESTDPRAISRSWRILDAGSGTGHHLAKITAILNRPVIGLGVDISRDAARHAARRWPTLAFAVADLWTEWPIHDAAVDLVVSIFAPKNFPETARVLRPGGWLAIAYPGPDHMIELTSRFGLIKQHEEKTRRYREAAARFVGRSTITRLLNRALLDGRSVRSVVLMGPNGRRVAPSALDVQSGPLAVTFDINVLIAHKHERMP